MRPVRTPFDSACHRLAAHVLQDREFVTRKETDSLVAFIQQAIEDWRQANPEWPKAS